MTPKLKGVLYIFASAAFLGATFIASKQAMLELTPLGFSAIWFAASAPERVAALRAALARFLDGAVDSSASGAVPTAEELELLRELGYAGDDE
jgi:hypothetical protein